MRNRLVTILDQIGGLSSKAHHEKANTLMEGKRVLWHYFKLDIITLYSNSMSMVSGYQRRHTSLIDGVH